MKSKSTKGTKQPQGTTGDAKTLIGQVLVELGYITIYQLDEALAIQRQDSAEKKEGKPLGQILLELGYCGPNQLIRAIQVQSEYRKVADPED
jgi:hypothetical protein